MQEILDAITNMSLRIDVINKLKKITPENDEIKGVKLFLEKNEYNFQKLALFLQSSEVRIESITNKSDQKRSFNWLKVAAVLIPIIVITYIVFINIVSPYDKLYFAYYEKELGLPVVLSKNTEKIFNESMNLFRSEDYESSLKGFNQLLVESPKNDTLNYFIGVCKLELNKNDEAIKFFKKDYNNSFFEESAEYRLAMVYIKIGELEKSKEILLNISNNLQHKYNDQATKLLKEKYFN